MFAITSSELVEQGILPERYSFAGGNTSPPLAWRDAPQGTRSFALGEVDPDVPWGQFGLPGPGTVPADLFVHWMIYDIPASVTSLQEGASPRGTPPAGAKQLNNTAASFGPEAPYYPHRFGYFGSAPPPGDKAHAYLFTLYALDVESLGLSPDAGYPEFTAALGGKVLATARLTVYYAAKQG